MTKAKPKADPKAAKHAAKVKRLVGQLPAFLGRNAPSVIALVKGEKPKKG